MSCACMRAGMGMVRFGWVNVQGRRVSGSRFWEDSSVWVRVRMRVPVRVPVGGSLICCCCFYYFYC